MVAVRCTGLRKRSLATKGLGHDCLLKTAHVECIQKRLRYLNDCTPKQGRPLNNYIPSLSKYKVS